MHPVTEIRNEQDYAEALNQLDAVFFATGDTPECREMHRLADLIEAYEKVHYPFDGATPADIIKFLMDQQGKKLADIAPYIGGDIAAYKALRGDALVTPHMAVALGKCFGVSPSVIYPGSEAVARVVAKEDSGALHRLLAVCARSVRTVRAIWAYKRVVRRRNRWGGS